MNNTRVVLFIVEYSALRLLTNYNETKVGLGACEFD